MTRFRICPGMANIQLNTCEPGRFRDIRDLHATALRAGQRMAKHRRRAAECAATRADLMRVENEPAIPIARFIQRVIDGGDIHMRLLQRHAVKEMRIDHAAIDAGQHAAARCEATSELPLVPEISDAPRIGKVPQHDAGIQHTKELRIAIFFSAEFGATECVQVLVREGVAGEFVTCPMKRQQFLNRGVRPWPLVLSRKTARDIECPVRIMVTKDLGAQRRRALRDVIECETDDRARIRHRHASDRHMHCEPVLNPRHRPRPEPGRPDAGR